MKVPRCKGMCDILPEDMEKFRHIEDVFRNTTERWGYEEVRTPTLEYLHLFTATGTLTPGMLGRVYTFLDWDGWSGERVVLRPEGTIPIARMCAEHLHSKGKDGIKRYSYVGNVFTFEGTGKESREQWQCGVELVGGGGALADIELAMLASEVVETLGIGEIEVGLSHAGLIKAIIAELGLGDEQQTKIMDQVLEGNIKALGEVKTKDKELKKALDILLDIKGDSAGYLENIIAIAGKSLAGLEPCLKDFTEIAGLLTAAGCKYHIDISSGAGFEYYTGAMFQFYVSGQKIGGGGRYDDLISLVGGPHMPASGFALYVDKLTDMLKIEAGERDRILLNIGNAGEEELTACLKLAGSLRKSGYVVAFELKGKNSDDFRWIVTPSGKGSFKLVDRNTFKQVEVTSESQIKKALEDAR
jgi:histidyl-tRNA synthetase